MQGGRAPTVSVETALQFGRLHVFRRVFRVRRPSNPQRVRPCKSAFGTVLGKGREAAA